jgi:hypothetical protein
MSSLFRKATREQAKLRFAIIGPAGAGKTYTALDVGTNLITGGRVAVIDTECGSAELYAKQFAFDTMQLSTHSPLSYVDAIHAAEAEGYDVIIIDSLSHAWIGKDGALEQVDKAAERGSGNSFTAWRTVTPKHNKLVEAMVACKTHLIATIRSKMEYVQEKNEKTGKTEIRKVGLAAIQRDGLEYEFTLVGDIDLQNNLKISKTRLNGVIMPGDIFEKPGAKLAAKISGWLLDGAIPKPTTPASVPHEPNAIDEAFEQYLIAIGKSSSLADLDAAVTGPAKPAKGTPEYELVANEYRRVKAEIEAKTQQAVSA